jgi:hypothetical protein
MAVPDTLLNAIRSPASTGKSPLEKLDAAPFAGADGSGFASVMRDVAPPPDRRESGNPGGDEQLAGNELPELPEMPARFFGSNRQPASDATLEEFAVEMGIDRSLARLLLTGTANDEVVGVPVLTPSEPSAGTEPSADSTAAKIVRGVGSAEDTPALPPWFIVPSPAVRVDSTVTVTSEIDVQAGTAIPSQLNLENTVQPLADEDLLLWRASVGRAHGLVMLPEATHEETQLPTATARSSTSLPLSTEQSINEVLPRHSPVLNTTTVPSVLLPLSTEQSINEVLLRRSSSFGGGIDLRVLEAMPTGELGNERVTPLTATATLLEGVPVAKEPSSIIKEPLVLTGNGDTRIAPSQWTAAATADNKIRSIHELALRRASVTSDDPASDPQTKSLSPSEVDMHLAQMTANIAGSAVSLTPTANMPSAPLDLATTTVIAAVAVSAEGAGQGQAFAGQGSLTGGAETSQVLSAPDPKLTFGERVQAFADAVAQRVLGQIRNENWSVSLQLDPANLGAMEIDLTLRGNAVTANLGVANAEVRALLEAGLPRLKESLEASGLQLASWSFGQSGSRGFGESMPTPFAWQPLRGVPDDADSSADASRLAAMRHNEGSRSAVDLFV